MIKIKRKLIPVIIIIVICSALGIYLLHKPKYDHTPKPINAYMASIIPQIDGIESLREWSDTEKYVYTWGPEEQQIAEGVLKLELAFKHNESKLFILIKINDKFEDGQATVDILLDNCRDGGGYKCIVVDNNLTPESDQWLVFSPLGFFEDLPFCSRLPLVHPDEPVKSSSLTGIHVIEASINLTRIKPVNNTVGMGIGISIGAQGAIPILKVPETWENLSTFPSFTLKDFTYSNGIIGSCVMAYFARALPVGSTAFRNLEDTEPSDRGYPYFTSWRD